MDASNPRIRGPRSASCSVFVTRSFFSVALFHTEKILLRRLHTLRFLVVSDSRM
jgi:hypothetical protein